MKEIIPPVDKELLEKELTGNKFLRDTNFGSNKLYIVTHHDSPNVMQEIGRLRELTFRYAGGGTGLSADIDEYDTMKNPYKQLIVWDPEIKEILGGYRFIICDELAKQKDGINKLATSKVLDYSDKFVNEYFPYLVELGRSFVQPTFQAIASRKAMFALDNLWDGLGALVIDNPQIKYFFGKVTMYTHYNARARDMILYFFKRFFPDTEGLVKPHNPLSINTPIEELDSVFSGANYEENYKILSQQVRALGENIPPLINSYMNLSPSMKTFGTVSNQYFGDVEETGIMVTFADMYPSKIERYLSSYKKSNHN
jgi:hypothetical protein